MEKTIADHEKHKSEAFAQFEHFKRRVEERECILKTEHSQKLIEISQEVLISKRDFEERLEKFNEWRDRVDSEREQALEDLKRAHQKELEDIRNLHENKSSDLSGEIQKIESRYKEEIEHLKNDCETLKGEKCKLTDDYELKLNKAQAFYENELEALRKEKSSTENEILNSLREEKEKLVKDFALRESELKKRLDSLVNQLSESEDNVEKYKHELEQLRNSLVDKETSSSVINKQVSIY